MAPEAMGVDTMTPLETLLVCLIAAAGVGTLRFAARRSPAKRIPTVSQDARDGRVRQLQTRREAEPADSRSPLRKAS